MRFFLIFSFLSLFTLLKSQNVDKLANIPSELKESEIRIYKGRGITNSGHIFRIYKDDKVWKTELIQWFLPKEISRDEFENLSPKLNVLKPDKSIEELFLNIKARNIGFLPKEEYFQYKKDESRVVYDEDEKDWAFETKKAIMVLDGTGYLVKYKAGKQENEFDYSNPESYLKHYPEINELNYFVDILQYIRKEFNIEF